VDQSERRRSCQLAMRLILPECQRGRRGCHLATRVIVVGCWQGREEVPAGNELGLQRWHTIDASSRGTGPSRAQLAQEAGRQQGQPRRLAAGAGAECKRGQPRRLAVGAGAECKRGSPCDWPLVQVKSAHLRIRQQRCRRGASNMQRAQNAQRVHNMRGAQSMQGARPMRPIKKVNDERQRSGNDARGKGTAQPNPEVGAEEQQPQHEQQEAREPSARVGPTTEVCEGRGGRRWRVKPISRRQRHWQKSVEVPKEAGFLGATAAKAGKGVSGSS